MARRALAGVAAVVLVTASAPAVRAQNTPRDSAVLLDVPYIQQSEALCGGAAAAMVLRYWGARGIQAETFASLVDRAAGGIRGDALLSELTGRGWNARSFRGDAALVQARLADRQPIIALIEDRPGAFHFVVLVAWRNGRVVLHDPARTPFRVMEEVAFERAWDKSGRWTLLVLPVKDLKGNTKSSDDRHETAVSATSACAGMVDDGVRSAHQMEYQTALETLQAAARLCPEDAAPLREIAGVFALQEKWVEAVSYAREAVRRNAADAHAWRILATASFVLDDRAAALEAWNRIDEPRIDTVTVQGLQRTRHQAATALMRLGSQQLLTARALEAANRRLDELPAAQTSRVTYRPIGSGTVAVDAVVIERPHFPTSFLSLTVVAARAVVDRELRGSIANLGGTGDLFTASWRWWEHRPRIGVTYATPIPFGGVLQVEGFRDEQAYLLDPRQTVEVRKGAGLTWSNWTTANLRGQISAGMDSWSGRGRTGVISGGLEQRLAADHVALRTAAAVFGGSFTAWTWSASAEWRSSPRAEGHVVLSRAGLDIASSGAPLALWPGAGSGSGRALLLRAHPLLDEGIVTGEVFGRSVTHAGAEWRRWFKPGLRVLSIAPALFVDAAHAHRRLQPGDAWHLDAGGGVRFAVPGNGILRVDVAKGLRDGRTAVSLGWMRADGRP